MFCARCDIGSVRSPGHVGRAGTDGEDTWPGYGGNGGSGRCGHRRTTVAVGENSITVDKGGTGDFPSAKPGAAAATN